MLAKVRKRAGTVFFHGSLGFSRKYLDEHNKVLTDLMTVPEFKREGQQAGWALQLRRAYRLAPLSFRPSVQVSQLGLEELLICRRFGATVWT